MNEMIITNAEFGSVRISRTPKVTGKGQKYFINKVITAMEERG